MNHRQQKGVTLISVLIVGAFAAMAILVGFRSVPAVTEYMALERIVSALAKEGDDGASVSQIRSSFSRRADVDNVTSVQGADLFIEKVSGRTLVEVEYERRVPLFANVSLVIDFHATSEGR
ncbi:DUF4845 domain-containing protein [Thauera propionica]|jgi:hypothetical protein|uniref:DUF4845 domain-containing protein n=1 Tax=Thauera propionica TaxID=2019431 RepID=A0A235F087_9RHOO|nr:DUF4845 domain-containing protein [Thauera propionica]MDD3676727.1 DUF4845 domain-containing protein [Thauera propionica]OYD54247.1 DUF4845 domain-containing protein [Thauera propionica]